MEDIYIPFLIVLALYLMIPMFVGYDAFYERPRPTLHQDYAANSTRDFAPLK